MTELRVATWNVHGLRDGVDAVAAAIRAERPDVLLAQESGPRRRLSALGDALGMSVASDPVVFPRRRVRNAVLVRPPLRVRGHRLMRFRGGTWFAPRGAMIAEVDGLRVVSLHLGLKRAERREHVRQLLEALGQGRTKVVIGGDLNAHPDDPTAAAIAAIYPDVWRAVGEGPGLTMPAQQPTARIDAIFAGPALRPLRARTAAHSGSDHLMVVADLELEP
ncbi:MAG TPA: endonuclease/exonuclease/phosphatase family protein [Actinomycetota bacterium]|nr:endonuclease/exonuclease/phosphatase family protein [Actinomycetota bacterium]